MSENRSSQAAGAAADNAGHGLMDELQQGVSAEAEPMLKFLMENVKRIIIGLAVVVVVIVAYGAYDYSVKSALKDSQSELGAILVNKDGAERLAALEAFAAKAPESVRPAALFELARLTTESGDFAKAAGVWDSLAGSLKGDMAFIAKLGKAQALMGAGKAEDAYAVLDAAQASAPEAFKQFTQLQYAVAAEETGKLDRAVAAYEALLAGGNSGEKSMYTHKVAVLKSKLSGN